MERKKTMFFSPKTCCCCWLPQWFGLESAHLFMSIDTDSWYITWLCSCPLLTLYCSSLFLCFFIFFKHCVELILKLRKCVCVCVCLIMGSLGVETAKKKAMWLYPKVLGSHPSERWGHSACSSHGVLYVFGVCLTLISTLSGLFFLIISRYFFEILT